MNSAMTMRNIVKKSSAAVKPVAVLKCKKSKKDKQMYNFILSPFADLESCL